MLIYDLETTGIDPQTARIVQIAFIKNNKEYNYLINPTIPIPEGATDVHKITNDMVLHRPTFKEASDELYGLINNEILCGYNNINYDDIILTKEFERCGLSLEIKKSIDSYQVYVNSEKTKKLGDAYKRYCNEEMEPSKAHTANYDVYVTKEILKAQVKLLGKKNVIESSTPISTMIVDNMFKRGKYIDKTLCWVKDNDIQYIKWLYQNTDTVTKLLIHNSFK